MKRFFILLLMILFSNPAVASIEAFTVDFTIVNSKVHVEESINFDKESNFTLELPEDASSISLYLNNELSNYTLHNNKINTFTKNIKLNYVTSKFIDKQNFLLDFRAKDDINRLSIRLILPTYAILAKPIDEKTLASNTVFPKPTKLETDGQRLVIIWERLNLKKDDNFSALAIYKYEKNNILYLFILSIISIGLIIFIILRKAKIKILVKKPGVKIKKIIKKVDLEKYLKEDEEQVVNILKQKRGQCDQGTLRVITGFSKAKLSSLLKELEERNIIYKEKRGKKNLIFLKE